MNTWALCGLAVTALATFGLGFWGARTAHTTSDFLAARRVVREERNAAAISGEYLSAASFLGIAGLVLKDGVDALWFPVGFTSGYLALMLFVAAPLRRSGAYTIPDFAEVRLDSMPLRWLSTVLVVVLGWMYLVPQLQGAGLALSTVTGMGYRVSVLCVAVIVLLTVFYGAMRAVTLVQAFQYWVKLFAITLPAFVLLAVFIVEDPHHRRGLDQPVPPVFERDTTVSIDTDVRLQVTEPVWLKVAGGDGEGAFAPGTVYAQPGVYPISAGTELLFPAGAPVPVVSDGEPDNTSWLRAQDDGVSGLVNTYSLLVATFLGTMGLPHVLARFYTNPSGHGARRTTLYVLILLGAFYLFPPIFGLLARFYTPELLVSGRTDATVLMLPQSMVTDPVGGLLAAVTGAGAFAAFLSTSAGLIVSLTGALSRHILKGQIDDFRLVSPIAALIPTVLAMGMPEQDITQSIGLVFAMAASTFCPLLMLGIWWRGLTAVGAAWGLLAGASLVLMAVAVEMSLYQENTLWSVLIHQPALLSVPASFLVMYVVSRATRHRVPSGVSRMMLQMHAPDRLGFLDDRPSRRFRVKRRNSPESSGARPVHRRHHRE